MTTPPKDIRLTIRLTPEERLLLEAKAGDRALSGFVRALVFDKVSKRRAARAPTQDTQKLAQILALLGRSNALKALTHLAQAAEHGVIDLDTETLAQITAAQSDLADIRRLLLRALGKTSP